MAPKMPLPPDFDTDAAGVASTGAAEACGDAAGFISGLVTRREVAAGGVPFRPRSSLTRLIT